MAETNKPVLLLNWDYRRKDLISLVQGLSEKFELVFLYYYDDKKTAEGFRAISWTNYKNAKELLKDVQPQKIVFHDIESFHQIALNIVARKKKIPTIVLEHGLRRGSEVEEILKTGESYQVSLSTGSATTFRFLLGALFSLNIDQWPAFIRSIYLRKKHGLTKGLYLSKYEFRQADRYINFTELNAGYIITRDGISRHKVVLIGNPQFDPFFQKLAKTNPGQKEKVIVLFDGALEEIPHMGISMEDKMEFFKKIAAYCKSIEMRLIIKLHPVSYKRHFEMEDIEIVRDTDIFDLILRASGCIFIYNSGLLALAMYSGKAILFNAVPEYNTEIAEKKLIPVFDFKNFKPQDIYFEEMSAEKKGQIVKDYFYLADGKAGQRLLEEVCKIN